MPVIGSGLLHHVDHTTRGMAIFGREGRGQNLDFFNGILNGFDGSRPTLLVVTHNAILEDPDGPVALPGQVIGAKVSTVGITARRHSGNHIQRGIDVPLIQRHLVEELAFHNGAAGRGLGFEQLGLSRHFNRLADFADLELGIHRQGIADAQIDIVADEFLEA